jgi:hypothetical protein
MTQSLETALARLRTRTFDPNEWVMIGDKKVRIINHWETSSKKLLIERTKPRTGKNTQNISANMRYKILKK